MYFCHRLNYNHGAKVQNYVLPPKKNDIIFTEICIFRLMNKETEARKAISKRVLEVFEHLKNTAQVPNQKVFAQSVGASSSFYTEIKNERSNVGVSVLLNTVLMYGISAHWLLTGEGDMTNCGQEKQEEHKPTIPTDVLQMVEIIRKQAEEIGELKEQIRQLEAERTPLEYNAEDADISYTSQVG